MKSFYILAAAAATFMAATSAQAIQVITPDDTNYVSLPGNLNTGVYGVETRRGNNALNGTWEFGAGPQTSFGTSFTQGQYAWGNDFHDFNMLWNSTGITVTIGGRTISNANAPLIGNTLNILVKRDATFELLNINGVAFNSLLTTPAGTSTGFFYWSPNAWGNDGLSLDGRIRIGGAQGQNSASGVNFSAGQFTPPAVPEPGTWMMLIAGFGLVGLSMRRRPRVQMTNS